MNIVRNARAAMPPGPEEKKRPMANILDQPEVGVVLSNGSVDVAIATASQRLRTPACTPACVDVATLQPPHSWNLEARTKLMNSGLAQQ